VVIGGMVSYGNPFDPAVSAGGCELSPAPAGLERPECWTVDAARKWGFSPPPCSSSDAPDM